MYRLLDCIAYEHHHGLLGVAVGICIIGSLIFAHMSARLVERSGTNQLIQIPLTGIIGGATIWSTHFLAMLAYEPGYGHGYETATTIASLAVAVIGTTVSSMILSRSTLPIPGVLGGIVFSITLSITHYLGLHAYRLPGRIHWLAEPLLASVVLGIVLGAVAFISLRAPYRAKKRRLISAAAISLTICSLHFVGMSAIEIHLDGSISVPEQHLSDTTLGIFIAGVTALIILIAIAMAGMELNLERETLQRLNHAVLHDPLTGLPNRFSLNEKLLKTRTHLKTDPLAHVALITVDLNLFKQVNDQHGHAVGDKVLQTLALRISDILKQGEVIARTGGDEFVAIKYRPTSTADAMEFCERLLAVILKPVPTEIGPVQIGASVGLATTFDDGRNPTQLLQKSDMAMYAAKSGSGQPICTYSAEIHDANLRKTQIIQDLRTALDDNQFELAYQMQNDVTSMEPVGFEALLRWTHPENGPVSPAEFIPIAEETGLIAKIGQWVLFEACKEAAQWSIPYSIAVNVSPKELVQPDFVENVLDILFQTQLPPERLELEITEACIIEDQAQTLRVMSKLKEIGIRIAMDDFGIGYSSLSTLQNFPFDKIKIDRSFIKDVHRDQQRAAIVRSTLMLGNTLNIPILAEGVEEEEELQFLRSEKCQSVQGFYFGKPMERDLMRQITNQTGKGSKAG